MESSNANDGNRERREAYTKTEGGPRAQQQSWPGTTEEMSPKPDHGEDSYVGSGKLLDKVALVTGGDSGIGRAVCIAFAREGADVAFGFYPEGEDEDAERTAAYVRSAQRRVLPMRCDLTQRDECRELVQRTVGQFGRIDVLVSNAAFQCESDFGEIEPGQLERTFATNVFAALWLVQAAVPHMPEGSSIIFTGSVVALEGNESLVDYSMTKASLHNLTKSLASALAERHIRVNCVAPGPVWTPLIPATLERDHVGRFGADTKFGRPAQPAEIAPSYVFLASRDASFYTGEVLAPTGRTTSR